MRFFIARAPNNCTVCEWIAAEGAIAEDTPTAFERFITAISATKAVIVFNSPGGSIPGGLKLGSMIRKLGYDTAIGRTSAAPGGTAGDNTNHLHPGSCESACAYAFLGGVRRFAVRNWNGDPVGDYGVHQFFTEDMIDAPVRRAFNAVDLSSQQAMTAILLEYTVRMGADPRLVVQASTTTPWQKMRFLTPEERIALRVDNMQPWSSGWRIEPEGAGAVARISVRTGPEEPLSTALFCVRGEQNHAYMEVSRRVQRWAELGADRIREMIERITLNVDGRQLVTERDAIASVRIDDNTVNIAFRLSPDQLQAILRGKLLKLSVSAPREFGRDMQAGIPLDGARDYVGLALRNCI